MRTTRQPDQRSKESGFTLLLALFILVFLFGIAGRLAIPIVTEMRSVSVYQEVAQSYYSSIAGLEEARARLMQSGPDAIPAASHPQNSSQVLYITNSTPNHAVVPHDPQSPYYDMSFMSQFPAGGTVTLVASSQPHAGTPFAVPFKWVRVAVKTEAFSNSDVNGDGVLDATTPIVFDGANQRLQSDAPTAQLVHNVVAYSVEPNGARKMLQYEVAGQSRVSAPGAMAIGGGAQLNGDVTVSGMDSCASGAGVPGIMAGGAVTLQPGATVIGVPTGVVDNTTVPGPTASELVQQISSFALPVDQVDPAITYDSASGTYTGSWVTLGDLPVFPPTQAQPPTPAVAHSPGSLTLSSGQGAGILLVEGDLTISGDFKYYGLMVVTGAVNLQGNPKTPLQIQGAILQGGSLLAETLKGGGGATPPGGGGAGKTKKGGGGPPAGGGGGGGGKPQGVTVTFDNCAQTLSGEFLPKTVLAFGEVRP